MKHADNISQFLGTKHKNTVYFGGRDVYINPKGYPSSRKNYAARKSMAQWIYHSLKNSKLTIAGFDITVHSKGDPYVYLATRQD